MSLVATTCGAVSLEHCQRSDQEVSKGTVQDHFELLDAAGMGFFGVVFYALTKHDFTVEQSRLTSDPVNYDSAGGIQKIQAVKICSPFCPSGIKASAKYLIKDIEGMKKVWSNMKGAVQHNFVRLYDWNTSIAPWYSMEAVMSGLTLEKLYKSSEKRGLPVPEELAFHLVDQITKATLFLHEKCAIVRADVNRENVMLRYAGRQTAVMPDVIMIDWSLWEEANEERIVKGSKDVYESVFPIIFKAGWECGASHKQEDCTANRTTHSPEWLDLHGVMRAQQLPLRCLEDSIASTASKCRQRIEESDQKAGAIRALMLSTGDTFTESNLKTALSVGEKVQQKERRKVQGNL
jgi:serine/threonine protein kinase